MDFNEEASSLKPQAKSEYSGYAVRPWWSAQGGVVAALTFKQPRIDYVSWIGGARLRRTFREYIIDFPDMESHVRDMGEHADPMIVRAAEELRHKIYGANRSVAPVAPGSDVP